MFLSRSRMFLKSSLQGVLNVRTIWQQRNRRDAMIARIKLLTAPSETGLVGDLAGIAALFLMLFAALALPGAA
jgi:hypothetical protein